MLRHRRMVIARGCVSAGLLFLLAAGPLVAQDGRTPGSLKTALLAQAAAQGIEILGADQLGDEPAPGPAPPFSTRTLRRLLEDYSYALEFAPAGGAQSEPRLLRIHIIGRVGKPAAEPLQETRNRSAGPNPAATADPFASPVVANIRPVDPLSGFGPLVRRGSATGTAPAPPR